MTGGTYIYSTYVFQMFSALCLWECRLQEVWHFRHEQKTWTTEISLAIAK